MTLNNFGHWKVFDNVDIKDFLAFTYVIVLDDGRKYAGAKKIWRRIKVPPAAFKRGPKKGYEQSDWMDYKSSSNELHQDLIVGTVKIKEMFITGFYDTWGKALYAEALLQIDQRVLSSPDWLNFQIEGQFTPSCDDPVIYDHIARTGKYLNLIKAGAQKPETLAKLKAEMPSMFPHAYTFENPLQLFICAGTDETPVTIESYEQLSLEYEVSSSKFDRLLDGSIDEIELLSGRSLKLPGAHRRTIGVVMHIPSSKVYMKFKDAQDAHGYATKKLMLDSGEFQELKPQTRAEFKEAMIKM